MYFATVLFLLNVLLVDFLPYKSLSLGGESAIRLYGLSGLVAEWIVS